MNVWLLTYCETNEISVYTEDAMMKALRELQTEWAGHNCKIFKRDKNTYVIDTQRYTDEPVYIAEKFEVIE